MVIGERSNLATEIFGWLLELLMSSCEAGVAQSKVILTHIQNLLGPGDYSFYDTAEMALKESLARLALVSTRPFSYDSKLNSSDFLEESKYNSFLQLYTSKRTTNDFEKISLEALESLF